MRQFEIEVYDTLATSTPRNGSWEIDVVPNNVASVGKRVDIWVYASSLGTSAAAANVSANRDLTTMVGEPADGDSVIAVGAHVTKATWPSCASGGCTYGTSADAQHDRLLLLCRAAPRRRGQARADRAGIRRGDDALVVLGRDRDLRMPTTARTWSSAGTSFSAPHVSGAAALFMQYQPHSSPSMIRQSFEAHARTDAFTGARAERHVGLRQAGHLRHHRSRRAVVTR